MKTAFLETLRMLRLLVRQVFFFFSQHGHHFWIPTSIEKQEKCGVSVSCEYIQHLHSCHSKDLPTNRILDPLPSSLVQHLLKASVFKEVGN